MQLSEADPSYTVDLDGAIDYIHGFHDDCDLDDDGVGELLSHSRILDFSGRVVYIVNTPDAHSCRFNPNLRDGDQVIFMCDSDMDHGTGGYLDLNQVVTMFAMRARLCAFFATLSTQAQSA